MLSNDIIFYVHYIPFPYSVVLMTNHHPQHRQDHFGWAQTDWYFGILVFFESFYKICTSYYNLRVEFHLWSSGGLLNATSKVHIIVVKIGRLKVCYIAEQHILEELNMTKTSERCMPRFLNSEQKHVRFQITKMFLQWLKNSISSSR